MPPENPPRFNYAEPVSITTAGELETIFRACRGNTGYLQKQETIAANRMQKPDPQTDPGRAPHGGASGVPVPARPARMLRGRIRGWASSTPARCAALRSRKSCRSSSIMTMPAAWMRSPRAASVFAGCCACRATPRPVDRAQVRAGPRVLGRPPGRLAVMAAGARQRSGRLSSSRAVGAAGARLPDTEKVRGSNPLRPTIAIGSPGRGPGTLIQARRRPSSLG